MPDPVTVLISWAHRDPGWTPTQVEERRQQVLRLAWTLRENGIDADLDLFRTNVDWTRWGPARVREVDVVLVVASPAWADAWEGRGEMGRNIGAAAEANVLLTIAAQGRDALQRKCRIITLPGFHDAAVPDGMSGIARYQIDSYDAKVPGGFGDLVRDLTGQPAYPAPPLGRVPVLPPTLADPAGSDTIDPDPAAKVGGPAQNIGRPAPSGPGNDELIWKRWVLEAQLAAMPTPRPGDDDESAWVMEQRRVRNELTHLIHTTVADPTVGDQSTPESQPADGADDPGRPETPDNPDSLGGPLPWVPAADVAVDWFDQTNHGGLTYRAQQEAVYVHLVPDPVRRVSGRVYAQASRHLPTLLRDHADPPAQAGLEVDDGIERSMVRVPLGWARTNEVVSGGLCGVRLIAATGAVCAWAQLPRDPMGSVLDTERLIGDIADCLALASAALATADIPVGHRVAVAAEVTPTTSITDASLGDLGHRTSATMRGAMVRRPVRMEPDEALPAHLYASARRYEIADTVAQLLMRSWNTP